MNTNPKFFRGIESGAGSLMELAVAAGIVLALLSLAVPTMLGVLEAGRMNLAAELVQGRLMEARGMAISMNCDVEVRLYRNSRKTPLDGSSGQGMQIYRIKGGVGDLNAGQEKVDRLAMMPAGEEARLPASVQFSSDDEVMSFWNLPIRLEQRDGGQREYAAFRWRPDGSTDLAEEAQWTLTLVRHPEGRATELSRNYVVFMIDPVTGHVRRFRPE